MTKKQNKKMKAGKFEVVCLGNDIIISKIGMAKLFNVSPATIDRAIENGEIPRPADFLGREIWALGVIVERIKELMEEADR
jgi:predicted DNA-binding transcriptional regulator AlpA